MPRAGGMDGHRPRGLRRPPARPKGSDRRCPCGPGGENITRVPPNLHSVDVDSHSWLTESRESRN
eukprot:3974133-Pleurochrysis_carterae.AAC.1